MPRNHFRNNKRFKLFTFPTIGCLPYDSFWWHRLAAGARVIMKRAYHVALLVWAVSAGTFADNIELSDGRKFNGTLNRSGDVVTIKTDDGKTVTVRPDQIAKVTLTNSIAPEEA